MEVGESYAGSEKAICLEALASSEKASAGPDTAG